MGVITDILITPKNPSVSMVNPAIVSELILDGLQALDCLTKLDDRPTFDRQVKMRFVGDVMIARMPIYYPWADGSSKCGFDGQNYTQRTPNIYYCLGTVDREAYEDAHQALREMQDYVSVHVDSNKSGNDLIQRLGYEILKKSKEFRVFFRKTDIDKEYTELFL